MEQYKGAAFGKLSPHPFAVADAAYRCMIEKGKNQSIVVSGESGAGKTKIKELLMHYLACLGPTSSGDNRSIEQKVLKSNPVLEAFGNAKVRSNNNSSRFGKYVEVEFDQKGNISGAAIRTYLLEMCRVCQVTDEERNYHCFYMVCAAPQKDLEVFKLKSPGTYHYLNQSSCYKLEGVDDAKEYRATVKAMEDVGIKSEEQHAIFRVVAAILHLGNIEFAEGEEKYSCVPKDKESYFHLKTAAELFMCDAEALEDALCKWTIVINHETVTRGMDPKLAAVRRDALAKFVYSRTFDRLVDRINSSISRGPNTKFSIGLLDIYGFESLPENSFEQFCTNWASEKLIQHFNQHVFKMEQEEYTQENITWDCTEYNNQHIIDLLEKKSGGIIACLDEACLTSSNPQAFCDKLYQRFKNNKVFHKPIFPCPEFTICHYAGTEVKYEAEMFLEKNKDYNIVEHQKLLAHSKCSFVKSLLQPLSEEIPKISMLSSVGLQFEEQLDKLLETLSATEPHYIRCVKPNNLLKPAIFEDIDVLQQLRCGGVMEAIRISCAGFPTRRPFLEFKERFGILAPEFVNASVDDVTACKKVLEKVGLKDYQIGKTKLFLKAGQMAKLEARRTELFAISGHLVRRRYESMQREASSLRIQRHLRRHLARKSFKGLCYSVVYIQKVLRGMNARSELRFRRQTRAAIIFQCAWRGRKARAELRNLKMANMEVAKTQEITKLQSALQDKQLQIKEMKEMLANEIEVSKKLTEQMLLLQEAMDKLVAENEKFKALVSSLEKKIDETVNIFEGTKKLSEERLKEALEAKSRIVELELVIKRQEEKVSDVKFENQMIWQQALLLSTVKPVSEYPPTQEAKESVDALIDCVEKSVGLTQGKQAAAFTIYKCLLHWKSFEAERTDVFDRLIQMIGSAIESQIDNGHMAYWLSNTSTLLLFLQRGLKHAAPIRKPPLASSLSGRMTLGFHSSPSVDPAAAAPAALEVVRQVEAKYPALLFKQHLTAYVEKIYLIIRDNLKNKLGSLLSLCIQGFHSSPSVENAAAAPAALEVVRQVEAKYPALLFKQHLTAYVEKIYLIIRDNLKNELGSLLSLCIQAPRTSKGSALKSGRSFDKDSHMKHWQGIIGCLNALLSAFKEHAVPPIIARNIFTQNFSYINVFLFNSLLLHRECCSLVNGEYVEAGLVELDHWCCQAKEEAGSAWDELKHIRQAVVFLVRPKKFLITYDEITNDMCSILSVQQLYRICTMYWDGNHNTGSVSPDVISRMRTQMKDESNSDLSNSFLLNENSSIPFSVDDFSDSLQLKDFSDIRPAAELVENPVSTLCI